VSPNPSSGNFKIEMPTDEHIIVTIFSIDGKRINSVTGSQEIEIKGLLSGLYILQISSRDGASIYKKQIIR